MLKGSCGRHCTPMPCHRAGLPAGVRASFAARTSGHWLRGRSRAACNGLAREVLQQQRDNIEGDPLAFLDVTEAYWRVSIRVGWRGWRESRSIGESQLWVSLFHGAGLAHCTAYGRSIYPLMAKTACFLFMSGHMGSGHGGLQRPAAEARKPQGSRKP